MREHSPTSFSLVGQAHPPVPAAAPVPALQKDLQLELESQAQASASIQSQDRVQAERRKLDSAQIPSPFPLSRLLPGEEVQE